MTRPLKKFILSAFLITFLLGGFFVWQANIAKAVVTGEPTAADKTQNQLRNNQDLAEDNQAAAQNINLTKKTSEPSAWDQQIPVLFHAIGGLFFLILKLLNGLVWLGANLADAILGITSFTKVNVVTIGWGITRDLANMFFALILLIMSISTILQIGGFTYKDILKRLVIAALLINFSLMFAGIIIDFAQVMTSYFLTAGAGGTGISANLTNGLKIVQVYDFSNTDQSIFQKMSEVMWGPTLQMIVEQFMAILLFMAAAFSFFAMSFFLIARIVWIWLLLIGAPLAWISFIIPNAPGQLGGLWNKWWQAFLKWTFFAPIYAFFLYLALTIAKNGIGLKSGNWGGGAASANALPLQSGFFAAPEIILQYIVIIMILLAGLKVAQDMGITGANTIAGWGKKAVDKAKDYIKRPGQWAYDSTAGWAAQKLGKRLSAAGDVRGLGWLFSKAGHRLQARGVLMEMEPAERDRHKDYAKQLGFMADKDLLYEMNHAYGVKKLLAVRQAKERGLLEKDPVKAFDETEDGKKNFSQEAKDFKEDLYEDKNDPKYLAVKKEHDDYVTAKKNYYESKENTAKTKESRDSAIKARDILNSYGLKDDKGKTKEGKEMEEARPDILNDKPAEQQAAIRRIKENGSIDKLKPIVVRDEQTVEAIRTELSPPEMTEVFKKWGKQTKKTFEETLVKSFADMQGLTGDLKRLSEEVKKRSTFADITGKVHTAFAGKNGVLDDEGKRQLAKYVSTMTAAKIADMRHPGSEHDIGFVGRYASHELALSVGRERSVNTTQKNAFYNGARGTVKGSDGKNINIGKNNNPDVEKALNTPGGEILTKTSSNVGTQNNITAA